MASYTALFASESGHWYTRQGEPAYEVMSAKGSMRPTTLRDARKMDLVPSVTSILKVAAKPGLEIWKQTQIIHAALTLPRNEGESEDDFARRVVQDSQEQAKKAREKGTEIHGAIEWSLSGGEVPSNYKPIINEIDSQFRILGITGPWLTEKSFASELGYGGKVDLHSKEVVVDFKTKDNWDDPSKLGYDEHGMQLSAYRVGLGIPEARRLNVFVSTQEIGKIHVMEWGRETEERHWGMFLCLLEYWKLNSNLR